MFPIPTTEKALDHSSGSPLTYIPHRLLVALEDYTLNRLVREYVPEKQMVVYILQRGMDRNHVAVPFSYHLYSALDKAPGRPEGRGIAGAKKDI